MRWAELEAEQQVHVLPTHGSAANGNGGPAGGGRVLYARPVVVRVSERLSPQQQQEAGVATPASKPHLYEYAKLLHVGSQHSIGANSPGSDTARRRRRLRPIPKTSPPAHSPSSPNIQIQAGSIRSSSNSPARAPGRSPARSLRNGGSKHVRLPPTPSSDTGAVAGLGLTANLQAEARTSEDLASDSDVVEDLPSRVTVTSRLNTPGALLSDSQSIARVSSPWATNSELAYDGGATGGSIAGLLSPARSTVTAGSQRFRG